jgi:hypothetical protein
MLQSVPGKIGVIRHTRKKGKPMPASPSGFLANGYIKVEALTPAAPVK